MFFVFLSDVSETFGKCKIGIKDNGFILSTLIILVFF